MEVHHPATLILGHLGEGQPDLDTPVFRGRPQRPVEGDGGPAPQLPGVEVPDGLVLVVVAVPAQRLTEPGIIRLVGFARLIEFIVCRGRDQTW
jgi:hypothetical protein